MSDSSEGEGTGVDGVEPRITALFDRDGVQIQDPIEDAQVNLLTDGPVEPARTETTGFPYPVGAAVTIEATAVQTTHPMGMFVRDPDGDVVAEVNPEGEYRSFSAQPYFIELVAVPMKVYLRVDDGFDVIPRDDEMQLLFDPDTTLTLGVRSKHTQPAQTITTTESPEGLMEAVSVFGNSMKTWSPERTFPTLRGHPPLVEYGDTSAFDQGHSPPETGIEIRVPAAYEWVFPVVPLAYWLGATVRPGEEPVLETNGSRYPLGAGAGYEAENRRLAFEAHVKDILQYTFILEAAMRRTYDTNPPPREQVEASELGLDLDTLYERPLAERLDRCLEVLPFPDVDAVLERPYWDETTDVEPTPEQGPLTPFMARNLSVVRAMTSERLEAVDAFESDAGSSPFEAGGSAGTSVTDGGSVLSEAGQGTLAQPGAEQPVVSLPECSSFTQSWAGTGVLKGGATVSLPSYLQRLEKLSDGQQYIQVDVVVNDEAMVAEEEVLDVYGSRAELEFGVTLHEQLSTSELAALLESDTDFIHYVGHVDPEGFRCRDGYLDARSLGEVGVDIFVLNACASFTQGQQLLEKGAIAGVVTLKEVISSAATIIGKRFAELLNYGFSVSAATELIRETEVLAQQYVTVGDTKATLAQPSGGTTMAEQIERGADGELMAGETVYASWNMDQGSFFVSHYDEDERMMVPGRWGPREVSKTDIREALNRWRFPVIAGSEFYWSESASVEDVLSALEDSE